MNLLFVVQRYGSEVGGGSELACREFATRMGQRGHHVEVVTSCAKSYLDWANAYQAGTEIIDGVLVHRLPVDRLRDLRFFGPLDARVAWGRKPVPLFMQEAWMHAQGPILPDLTRWLAQRASEFDVVIFFTYLYFTTWRGLPVAAGLAPTILHPTAHDEPAFRLPLFDLTFRHPRGIACFTEEERDLVRGRFRIDRPFRIVGIGIDLEVKDDPDGFRSRYGLEDRPYLLFAGRVDPAKGSEEVYDFFITYKRRNPGPLNLVFVGEEVRPVPPHPDVVATGFVDGATRFGALAGCTALVQPSYFESFSLVLCEAWAMHKPALVQGHCDVLLGQALRSGGAIPYRGFAEFEAAVDLLLETPSLARSLGEAGRRYVESRYDWSVLLDTYESLLEEVATSVTKEGFRRPGTRARISP